MRRIFCQTRFCRVARPLVGLVCVGAVLALAGCGVLRGEERQAKIEDRAEARQKLERVHALFDKANRGYSAPAAEGEQPQSTAAFKVATLKQAIEPLQWIIDSNAPQHQKQTARALLATIHSSRASHASQLASEAALKLDLPRQTLHASLGRARQSKVRTGDLPIDQLLGTASPTTGPATADGSASGGGDQGEGETVDQSLASQLFAVRGGSPGPGPAAADMPEAAGSRIAAITQIIDKLKNGPSGAPGAEALGLSAEQARQQRLAEQIQAIRDQIGTQDQPESGTTWHRVQTLEQQASEHAGKSQQLWSQAADADGERRYQLQQQASEAEAAGRQASFEAEQLKAEIQRQQWRLADLRQQRDVTVAPPPQRVTLEPMPAGSGIDMDSGLAADQRGQALSPTAYLQQQIDYYENQAKLMRQERSQAVGQFRDANEQAMAALGQLQSQYKTVADHYKTAAKRMDQAVSILQQAVQAAQGGERADLQAELLEKQIQRARVLSAHAQLANSLANSLRTAAQLASDPALLSARQSQQLDNFRGQLRQAHQQLSDQLSEAVESGKTNAEQVEAQPGRQQPDEPDDEETAAAGPTPTDLLEQYQSMAG